MVLVDEMSGALMAGGYYERPGMFGFEHCRLLVVNTSLILGAIMRRDRQIKRFLRSFEKGRDLYFEVRKTDTDNAGQGQRGREERALEQFILCSGWERRPHLMRDLGREPLLTHIEDVYRTHLLGRIDPDHAMRFNGSGRSTRRGSMRPPSS